MINWRNTAYILVLCLGLTLLCIGLEINNNDLLNASYSIFSGWIVGFLCSIHDREKRKDLIKELNSLKHKRSTLERTEKNVREIWNYYSSLCTPIFTELDKNEIRQIISDNLHSVLLLSFYDNIVLDDKERDLIRKMVLKTKKFYENTNVYIMSNPSFDHKDIKQELCTEINWIDDGEKMGNILNKLHQQIAVVEKDIAILEFELT